MIDGIGGLSQEAQLRYKLILENQDAFIREMYRAEEVTGKITGTLLKVTKEVQRSEAALNRLAGSVGDAGGQTSRQLGAIGEAAKKARLEIDAANRAVSGSHLSVATSTPLEGSRPLSSFSNPERSRLLALDDAVSASAIAGIRNERQEREKATREAIDGFDRMYSAIAKSNEAQRRFVQEDLRRGRNDWDREFIALQDEVAGKTAKSTTNLISQRYALYDVASTARFTGAALLTLATAYEMVAVNRERAFAEVRRTSGFNESTGGIDQLDRLRTELRDLTREIPKTFTELAGTATVGGQLGLNAGEIERYVTTVTKFSTVSGIAADDAGMRIGKLRNILGLTADGYEVLARSIAFAGAESAATEDQILSVAAEIAPYARQVKFGATETTGLATALAALQIAPERARSAFQDMARSIDGAVAVGGEKLRNYASISRMTVEEFATLWKDRPSEAFQAFTRGFASVDNATLALRTLGLDGARVAPTLLSLANNADLVAASFEDARAGVGNGFLDTAFAVTVGTVAEQFQLLINEVANLADAIGGPTLSALGGLIVMLRDTLQFATDLAESPLGEFFAPVATGVMVLVGSLVVLAGVSAAAGGSMLAVRTAVGGLNGMLPPFIANLINTRLGFLGVNIEARQTPAALAAAGAGADVAAGGMTRATVAARVLRGAVAGLLASTGIGLLLTLLGNLGAEALANAGAQDGMATSVGDANPALGEQASLALQDADALREAVAAANEFAMANAGLEGALFDLGKSMGENGRSFSAYSTAGRTNMQALQQAITAATTAAGGDAQTLANLLLGLEQQLVQAGASDEALGTVRRALQETGVSASRALVTSNSLAVGLGVGLDSAAKKAGKSVNGLGKELRTVADYASDLKSVFDRSLEIRFGPTQAYDAILRKYSEMRKSAADAANKISDIRDEIRTTEAELRGIEGSRAGLEYGLSIASQYGDTIRAAQISGEIARLNAQEGEGKTKLTSLNGQLVEQQEALNRSLIGNSDAAVQNRADVYELVDAYASYLTALADSGASQEQLEEAARNLSAEFGNNLVAMGFNRDEINTNFAPAIVGLGDIISSMPRDVTFEILGLDAAQAALQEHLLKMKEGVQTAADDIATAMENATAQMGDSFSQVGGGAQDGMQDAGDEVAKGAEDIKMSFIGVIGWLNDTAEAILIEGIWGTAKRVGDSIRGIIGWVTTGKAPDFGKIWTYNFDRWYQADNGYYDGGYTGDGGKFDVAGSVHRGEYVMPQKVVRYFGVENMARIHRVGLGRGYAMGGLGGSTPGLRGGMSGGDGVVQVEIVAIRESAADRLSEAGADRPVLLHADGRVLAQVVSAGNAAYSRSA